MSFQNPIFYWKDDIEAIFVLENAYASLYSPFNPAALLERDKISLVQNSITIFGKTHLEPRLTAWMGPPYQYSNIQWPEASMSPIIEKIAIELGSILDFSFNAVLINYYRNGQDSMGRHRDNEPEIDQQCIASISFGASRLIRFTCPDLKKKIDIVLNHGDLLVMQNMQQRWWHELPKRKNINQPRLNLTFRKIKLLK